MGNETVKHETKYQTEASRGSQPFECTNLFADAKMARFLKKKVPHGMLVLIMNKS